MDLFAAIFGFALLSVAAVVTYLWGIKPDREQKKRRAEQMRAEYRRQRAEAVRRQAAMRGGSISNR
jgi:hypothetical protein